MFSDLPVKLLRQSARVLNEQVRPGLDDPNRVNQLDAVVLLIWEMAHLWPRFLRLLSEQNEVYEEVYGEVASGLEERGLEGDEPVSTGSAGTNPDPYERLVSRNQALLRGLDRLLERLCGEEVDESTRRTLIGRVREGLNRGAELERAFFEEARESGLESDLEQI